MKSFMNSGRSRIAIFLTIALLLTPGCFSFGSKPDYATSDSHVELTPGRFSLNTYLVISNLSNSLTNR